MGIAKRLLTASFLSFILLGISLSCFAQSQESEAASQKASTSGLKLDTGKEIYEAACIGCHGPQGKGQLRSTIGFEPPSTFPDFSDCRGSTPEMTHDWHATIRGGGHARGFSEIMPSFREALSSEQIEKLAKYLRTLCTDPAWPLGELNLPRPLFTEKAFPENEAVLTTAFNANGTAGVSSEFSYERRIKARNQIEVAVPFSGVHPDGQSWYGGFGDLAIGLKRVLFAHMGEDKGSIFSLQGEIQVPTGNRQKGLGTGVPTFQTFAAVGQLLPKDWFIQSQFGADLPTRTTIDVSKAVFWNTAIGKTFAPDQGYGRIWTPAIEFLADRDLIDGAKTDWDTVPQLRVSLSKRQHIAASVGVRFPINNTAGRGTQVVFYVLWDWFDGGLLQGWK